MGLGTSIRKRYHWLTQLRQDHTGFLVYSLYGNPVYIRHKRHFKNKQDLEWECENLFYKHYLPGENDVVVDLGAGYGEEAVFLKHHSSVKRYLGVEAQPVVYECLSNTFHALGSGYEAVPFAISNQPMHFASLLDYAASGAEQEGYIDIPTINWKEFLQQYDVSQIDLFKINIEGGELAVLSQIEEFDAIKRFIISCHDFRAEKGHGEQYRTKKQVIQKLTDAGYHIQYFEYGVDYADDWIFAERD